MTSPRNGDDLAMAVPLLTRAGPLRRLAADRAYDALDMQSIRFFLIVALGSSAVPILPALAQAVKWGSIPTMQLEGLYRGPLRDTVVQRWRDPVGGNICYLFIPMGQEHAPANASGYVQYGPNTIGSISCVATPVAPRHAARATESPNEAQRATAAPSNPPGAR